MANYHLVILVHGLWGAPAHMNYIKSQIEQIKSEDGEQIVCYVTGSHAGFLTYDGIDVNGKRISDEILAETYHLQLGKDKVVKFSIIGYSLGGLISRYAIGYLNSIGYFREIEPVNFTTFCTPHVGVLNPGTSWGTRLYNFIAPRLLAHTGAQLFLTDKSNDRLPLLVWMSDKRSIFAKALNNFANKALYANVINDKRSSWYTSAISSRDPFKSMVNENSSAYDIEFIDGYEPIVVDISKPIKFKANFPSAPQTGLNYGRSSFLRKLNWVKVILGAIVLTPVWAIYFILNSIYQRIVNQRRVVNFFKETSNSLSHLYDDLDGDTNSIKSIEQEKESLLQNFEYDIKDETDTIVESVFAAMNSDTYKNYHDTTMSTTNSSRKSSQSDLVNLKGEAHDFTLVLTESQSTIIRNLNRLDWKKFPVLIRDTKMTHRAAIYRHNRPDFHEGKTVVKHFADEIFKI